VCRVCPDIPEDGQRDIDSSGKSLYRPAAQYAAIGWEIRSHRPGSASLNALSWPKSRHWRGDCHFLRSTFAIGSIVGTDALLVSLMAADLAGR